MSEMPSLFSDPMSQWITSKNMYDPDFLEKIAGDYTTRATKLKDDYKARPQQVSDGGLFNTGLFAKHRTIMVAPPGADYANSLALQMSTMATGYANLAKWIRENPDKPITQDQLDALHPSGPEVTTETLTSNRGVSRQQLDQALTINAGGGYGLRIPTYGS